VILVHFLLWHVSGFGPFPFILIIINNNNKKYNKRHVFSNELLLVVVQSTTAEQLCDMPADDWSYLLNQVQRHVQLQHVIDQVPLI